MSADDLRNFVDPELVDLLEAFPSTPLSAQTLAQRRAMAPVFVSEIAPSVSVKTSTRSVKGPKDAPDVPVRVYEPTSVLDRTGCVFHIHGGGYVMGTAAGLAPLHRKMSAELDCVVVSVEYRLAPETSFPGNIEDCYAALAWVFDSSSELNIDPQRIGVMGESAGGGLAASLALLARDRREYPLAFQHLIYPMLDDRTCVTQEPHPFAGLAVWTAADNLFGWSALLGAAPGAEDVSPYAAAARVKNLAGLPQTFMSTAALDLFVDEDIEYAHGLIRAGVPVELHVYPRAFHGFDRHPTAQVARAARRDSLSALAAFLGQPRATRRNDRRRAVDTP
jgi:acetyl esterase/lipase